MLDQLGYPVDPDEVLARLAYWLADPQSVLMVAEVGDVVACVAAMHAFLCSNTRGRRALVAQLWMAPSVGKESGEFSSPLKSTPGAWEWSFGWIHDGRAVQDVMRFHLDDGSTPTGTTMRRQEGRATEVVIITMRRPSSRI